MVNKKTVFGGSFLMLFLLSACGQNATIGSSVKDGSYGVQQKYTVEENSFYIDVKTTLKDGKIAMMNIIPDPNGKTAQKYASAFQKDIQSKIIGKTIAEAKNMGYVSGASSTSQAFIKALEAIEKQATTTSAQ